LNDLGKETSFGGVIYISLPHSKIYLPENPGLTKIFNKLIYIFKLPFAFGSD
jgi:hypothetical protein